jgi:predicted acylesterase/phospholipase RssA
MPLPNGPINLSLSGSGALYPAFIGTFWALADNGIEIAELSATSGGAVIAAGISSGMKPGPDMIRLVKETLPYRAKLFDPSWEAIKNWGLCKGDRIQAELARWLVPTFSDLTGPPLHIIGANILKRRKKIFSSTTTPNMSLSQAVRISIGLPFLFAPVQLEDGLYIDGGIALNAPTNVFSNGLPVLAVSFTPPPEQIQRFLDYLHGILDTLLDAPSVDVPNVHQLKIGVGISSLNYFISTESVDFMVEKAYVATETWLKTVNSHE